MRRMREARSMNSLRTAWSKTSEGEVSCGDFEGGRWEDKTLEVEKDRCE